LFLHDVFRWMANGRAEAPGQNEALELLPQIVRVVKKEEPDYPIRRKLTAQPAWRQPRSANAPQYLERDPCL
jgi:hypothetical protein